jgi:beta-phosphoglucomutase
MGFEAVIFDMDGVLIDARDWHFRALNKALMIFGVEITPDQHESKFNGLPTKVKLEMLSEEEKLPRHLHEYIDAVKQEWTLREAAGLCFPQVNHLILLAHLRKIGFKIGCATNSIRLTATTMLNYAGIMQYLDCLVTNEDVAKAKPDPEIYLKTSALLGVNPRNVLVVEDHPYGISAANAAGCTVVKVDGPHEVNIDTVDKILRHMSNGKESK